MPKEVLQKYIAGSGFCSRRKAEELIAGGEVVVNNEVARLGCRVDDADSIVIDGEKIKAIKEKIYIMLNKPVGITCTSRSFKDEKNVFSFLPPEYDILHVVGRLDKDSSGLVLLTNDGALTQKITHPSFQHEKRYIVTVQKNKERDMTKLRKGFVEGINLGEDGIVRAKAVELVEDDVFEVILTEGKKRQIRRMFGEFGERISDLKRVSIGDILLGDLKEGEWKKIDCDV